MGEVSTPTLRYNSKPLYVLFTTASQICGVQILLVFAFSSSCLFILKKYYSFFFVPLGMKRMALCMPGNLCVAELRPQAGHILMKSVVKQNLTILISFNLLAVLFMDHILVFSLKILKL